MKSNVVKTAALMGAIIGCAVFSVKGRSPVVTNSATATPSQTIFAPATQGFSQDGTSVNQSSAQRPATQNQAFFPNQGQGFATNPITGFSTNIFSPIGAGFSGFSTNLIFGAFTNPVTGYATNVGAVFSNNVLLGFTTNIFFTSNPGSLQNQSSFPTTTPRPFSTTNIISAIPTNRNLGSPPLF